MGGGGGGGVGSGGGGVRMDVNEELKFLCKFKKKKKYFFLGGGGGSGLGGRVGGVRVDVKFHQILLSSSPFSWHKFQVSIFNTF